MDGLYVVLGYLLIMLQVLDCNGAPLLTADSPDHDGVFENRLNLLEDSLMATSTLASKPKKFKGLNINSLRVKNPPTYLASATTSSTPKPMIDFYADAMLDMLRKRTQLSSAERIERTNRIFDRVVQFVNIMGQVDAYIADQAKLAVSRLNAMVNYDQDERRKRHH